MTINEFSPLMKKIDPNMDQYSIMAAFDAFDKTGRGYFTFEEYRVTLENFLNYGYQPNK
jgi:hypothetical protein